MPTHIFFGPGDEVEFDFSTDPELANTGDFPKSPWRGFVSQMGCNQLLVRVSGRDAAILAENCGTYVRLVSAGRDNSEIRPIGCRYLQV